nr:sigma-E processing peptidase SpoIIGA [uncultured Agathobaculum sp.]
MVVYLDVLFVTNLMMDYITLLAASRLGGVRVSGRRLLAAAALGGGYSVLAAVMPWMNIVPVRLIAGAGMCAAAFWRQKAFVRVCALYFVVSASFVGIAAVLRHLTDRQLLLGAGYYFAVPLRVLLLAAVLGYAVSGGLLRGDAMHGPIHREIGRMTICFGTVERSLCVLYDTGNELIEPVSSRPVLVLERGCAQSLLAGHGIMLDETLDTAAQLAALPEEQARLCGLLPYRTVGAERGLMLYFRPDQVRCADGGALDCVCAVGPNKLGQGAYEGLIGV